MWTTVSDLLAELHGARADAPGGSDPVAAVGIASMAETGLLVERGSGLPRTPFLPWFDRLAAAQADFLLNRANFAAEFCRHGVRPTFKCSLAKLLWLHYQNAAQLEDAVWLSMADYIALRLTGEFATHASLAVRTAAFCLDTGQWDAILLDDLCLPAEIFPPVLPAFQPVGGLQAGFASFGLDAGIPVTIAGHDHLCGAFAASSLVFHAPATVFQSIGTAKSLVGAFSARPLGEADFRSGFSFSLHAEPGRMAWVGGISASGGSVEWLRSVLGEPRMSYTDLGALLEGGPRPPTGIIYLPYLSGRGSPHSDGRARAAFIGLSAAHGRADLYQAVLEGVAYEGEYIRRAAQSLVEQSIERILAAGGGTRNQAWMQIRADVLGCPVDVLGETETTLLGAALLAGLGAGVYAGLVEVNAALQAIPFERYLPDASRHAAYRQIYEDLYAPSALGIALQCKHCFNENKTLRTFSLERFPTY